MQPHIEPTHYCGSACSCFLLLLPCLLTSSIYSFYHRRFTLLSFSWVAYSLSPSTVPLDSISYIHSSSSRSLALSGTSLFSPPLPASLSSHITSLALLAPVSHSTEHFSFVSRDCESSFFIVACMFARLSLGFTVSYLLSVLYL